MTTPPFERGVIPVSPEEQMQDLELRFALATRTMVDHMRLVGGNPLLPGMQRPEVDYTRIAGEENNALNLHSSDMWSHTQNGVMDPFGMRENVTMEILLPHYAIMTSDELVEQMAGTGAMETLGDYSIPEEERGTVWNRDMQPLVDRYVDDHRLPLMEKLFSDTYAAMHRVMRIPQKPK